MLGDGKSISVLTDPWLKSKANHLVENKNYTVSRSAKVCQLFKHGALEWDEERIREVFDEVDATAIMQTRIPQNAAHDRVAWVHMKDGCYSVKSGYHVWQESHLAPIQDSHSVGWKRLWNLKIPPKVKFFLWRLCRNNVPVRVALNRRCNGVPLICPMCNIDVEHVLHLFFHCDFAALCWQQMGVQYDIWEVEDVSRWLLDKLSSESYDRLKLFAMTLWGIWFFRNKKVWEQKVVTAEFAMDWSLMQLKEWGEACSRVHQRVLQVRRNNDTNNDRWVAPETGLLKVNVDASIVEGSSHFSVGMVLRDHRGDYLGGKVMKVAAAVSVLEAEAIGIDEALSWISSRTEGRVCVESDSLTAVQAINSQSVYHLEIGHILDACRLKLSVRPNIHVKHVRRLANRTAHLVARVPCELNCCIDLVSPPRFVLESLMYDALIE